MGEHGFAPFQVTRDTGQMQQPVLFDFKPGSCSINKAGFYMPMGILINYSYFCMLVGCLHAKDWENIQPLFPITCNHQLFYQGSRKLSSLYMRGMGGISELKTNSRKCRLGLPSSPWFMPYWSPHCLHHQGDIRLFFFWFKPLTLPIKQEELHSLYLCNELWCSQFKLLFQYTQLLCKNAWIK